MTSAVCTAVPSGSRSRAGSSQLGVAAGRSAVTGATRARSTIAPTAIAATVPAPPRRRPTPGHQRLQAPGHEGHGHHRGDRHRADGVRAPAGGQEEQQDRYPGGSGVLTGHQPHDQRDDDHRGDDRGLALVEVGRGPLVVELAAPADHEHGTVQARAHGSQRRDHQRDHRHRQQPQQHRPQLTQPGAVVQDDPEHRCEPDQCADRPHAVHGGPDPGHRHQPPSRPQVRGAAQPRMGDHQDEQVAHHLRSRRSGCRSWRARPSGPRPRPAVGRRTDGRRRRPATTVTSTTAPVSQTTPASPNADSISAISIWLAHCVGAQSR